MQWKRSEEFRAQARHCDEIARMMSTPEGRNEFDKLARGWLQMAERAEQEERLRGALGRTTQPNSVRQAGSTEPQRNRGSRA